MKPYSKDLRIKVLEAVDREMPREEVAEVFGVSVPSIKRWLSRGAGRPEMWSLNRSPGRLLAKEKLWKVAYPSRSSSTQISPSMSISSSSKSSTV